jgi:predicted signal transduction protein with EAL and GGDEF domain
MDDYTRHPSRGRETLLAVVLSLVVGGAFVLFLNFATGGFVFYAIAIAFVMSVFGLVHYFLWGRSFMKEVAEERRELELQDEIEQELRAGHPPWERRF